MMKYTVAERDESDNGKGVIKWKLKGQLINVRKKNIHLAYVEEKDSGPT